MKVSINLPMVILLKSLSELRQGVRIEQLEEQINVLVNFKNNKLRQIASSDLCWVHHSELQIFLVRSFLETKTDKFVEEIGVILVLMSAIGCYSISTVKYPFSTLLPVFRPEKRKNDADWHTTCNSLRLRADTISDLLKF